jgi:hypothetical protein
VGQLEYTALALDRPDDHFTNDMSNPETTRWTFHHTSPQQLEMLFASIELPDVARKFLLDPAHWESGSNALRITPPPEVIISLGAESRRKLYEVLAESPENVPQRIPFQFRENGFDDWFAHCGLPKEKIDLVRRLTYPQKGKYLLRRCVDLRASLFARRNEGACSKRCGASRRLFSTCV